MSILGRPLLGASAHQKFVDFTLTVESSDYNRLNPDVGVFKVRSRKKTIGYFPVKQWINVWVIFSGVDWYNCLRSNTLTKVTILLRLARQAKSKLICPSICTVPTGNRFRIADSVSVRLLFTWLFHVVQSPGIDRQLYFLYFSICYLQRTPPVSTKLSYASDTLTVEETYVLRNHHVLVFSKQGNFFCYRFSVRVFFSSWPTFRATKLTLQ